MEKPSIFAIVLLIKLMFGFSGAAAQSSRVITLGGSVTEIVYALGSAQQLVGVDQSSLYPLAAQQLPSVGYYRRLPVEGVASLKPTMVIASEHAGPPQVIEQLRALQIHVVRVSDSPTLTSLQQRVREIARALDQVSQGEVLLQDFDQALKRAKAVGVTPLKAVTVVMRGGKLLGAGRGTAAGVILEEAGLTNALSIHESYRPLSAEAMSALAPEVIIVTRSTVESLGSLQALKDSPILKYTPAVTNDRILVLDDLLAQGFGLRLPQAVHDIRQELSRADTQ
ncbi:ABC transporter substrate-binding protein [Zwartia sp.]|uniref:heme/hemin ABC transporter substrate-binding protein n=1 Tax=Zwartia sp. TaxID=2978004 RepID=UPI0027183FC6|nr:ABC transporter substrate-binding protein [Zwartia sp.]MDO9024503.1 ABC transporter substrate-binding protein [Zwartia sp.]